MLDLPLSWNRLHWDASANQTKGIRYILHSDVPSLEWKKTNAKLRKINMMYDNPNSQRRIIPLKEKGLLNIPCISAITLILLPAALAVSAACSSMGNSSCWMLVRPYWHSEFPLFLVSKVTPPVHISKSWSEKVMIWTNTNQETCFLT